VTVLADWITAGRDLALSTCVLFTGAALMLICATMLIPSLRRSTDAVRGGCSLSAMIGTPFVYEAAVGASVATAGALIASGKEFKRQWDGPHRALAMFLHLAIGVLLVLTIMTCPAPRGTLHHALAKGLLVTMLVLYICLYSNLYQNNWHATPATILGGIAVAAAIVLIPTVSRQQWTHVVTVEIAGTCAFVCAYGDFAAHRGLTLRKALRRRHARRLLDARLAERRYNPSGGRRRRRVDTLTLCVA
jgi:hypothetical protein